MRAFVIKMGEGLALPLPKNVAEKLGLGVGDCLEITGPDADGALRYTPVPESEAQPRVVRVPVRAVATPDAPRPPADLPKLADLPKPADPPKPADLPSPAEVAQAVSGQAPPTTPAPAPVPATDECGPEFEKELDLLFEKHEAALGEAVA